MGKLCIGCTFALLVVVIANMDVELSNAAANGNLALVKEALAAGGNMDVELSNAAANGNLALVKEALAAGGNPNWQHHSSSWPMATSLIRVSCKGNVNVVSELLKAGADPNLREYRNNTALHEAAYCGYLDLVPLLVSYGADVNLKDDSGRTPLVRNLNSYHPTMDMVRLLLNYGVDPNQKDNQGRTAAEFARGKGMIEMANFIDNFDTDSITVAPTVSSDKLTSPTTSQITTPTGSTIKLSSTISSQTSITNIDVELSNAAATGNLDLVKQALAAGANPNWQHHSSSWPMATSLIRASFKGSVNIVSELLKEGADPNLKEYRGNTALHEAAYYGHLDLVPLLVSYGADVNLKDNSGKTPLVKNLNSYHPNIDMVRLLLNYGVDPNQKDTQGRTAAEFARGKGMLTMANFIENFDLDSITAAPTISTGKLSSPIASHVTTPSESTVNFSSTFSSKDSKEPAPITAGLTNNMSVPLMATIACVVVFSMVTIIYVVTTAVKRFHCQQKEPCSVHFDIQ